MLARDRVVCTLCLLPKKVMPWQLNRMGRYLSLLLAMSRAFLTTRPPMLCAMKNRGRDAWCPSRRRNTFSSRSLARPSSMVWSVSSRCL